MTGRVGWRVPTRRLPTTLRVGGTILIGFFLVALTVPLWAPYSPVETVALPFEGASLDHPFGTDVLGRDVFTRVAYGTRIDLLLSLTSTVIAVLLGAVIGLASGYIGGWFDNVLMRAFEAIVSIPLLILALLVIAAAGPQYSGSLLLLTAVVVLVYTPRVARISRAVAVDLVTRDFLTVARSRGESTWSITRRELAPNASGVLLVEFGVRAGYAPILIGSLAFLGFGVRAPTPEWGLIISENRAALATTPVVVLAPAAVLAILIISLNLATDGLARYLGRTAVRTP